MRNIRILVLTIMCMMACAGAQAQFSADTFTGAAGALTAHTATDGTTWTSTFVNGGSSLGAQIDGSGFAYGPDTNDYFTIQTAGHLPSSLSYDVQCTCSNLQGTSAGVYGVLGYCTSISPFVYVRASWNAASSQWLLDDKYSSTGHTIATSATPAPVAGHTYTIKLSLRSNSEQMYISDNGGAFVLVASGTTATSNYVSSGGGYAGIWLGGAATSTVGGRISAFSATNISTAATGYTIAPSPASASTVGNGSTISLPISLTGGTQVSGSSLVISAALAVGLSGTFASSTGGVIVAGTGPYTITVPIGTYAGGINLTFVPNALTTNGTMTLTHSGAGFAAGGDPGPYTYTVGTIPTFTVNQPRIYTNSVNDAMSAVGTSTAWLVGTTFSLTGGTGASIVTNSVNATAQTANLKVSAGSAVGTLTLGDSADSATATVTVQTPTQTIALATGTLLIGNTITVTVTGTNTLYSSQVGEYFTLGGTAGAASSVTSTTINSDTSATITIVLGNATGPLTVLEVAPYGGGATSSNSLTVTSAGGVISYTGKVTQTANNQAGITLVAPTPSGIVGSAIYTWKRSTSAGFTFASGTTVGTNAATITDNPGTSGGSTVYYYKVQISDTNGDTPAITNNSDQMLTTQWGTLVQVVGLGDSVMAGQNATTNFLAQFVSALNQLYGFHTIPYANATNNQGHGGAATTEWLPTNVSTETIGGNLATNYYGTAKTAWNALAVAPTDIIVELMTNDLTRGNSSAQFLTNLTAIIDQIHTDFPVVRIWLTDSPVLAIEPDAAMATCLLYSAQMDSLCSLTGPRSALVSGGFLRRLDKIWPAWVCSNKPLYLSSDNVHPTNAGQTTGGMLMAYAWAKGTGAINAASRRIIH